MTSGWSLPCGILSSWWSGECAEDMVLKENKETEDKKQSRKRRFSRLTGTVFSYLSHHFKIQHLLEIN
jgi:hypothetical protein